MSTFTKEQLLERAREKVKGLEYALKHPGAFADTLTELEEELELARIALASLEAEPVISHVGSKNALDAIVSFIKSNRNPTLKDHKEVSERLFQDNCQSLSSHVIEYINQIGDELEELRSTQDTAPPAPVFPRDLEEIIFTIVNAMADEKLRNDENELFSLAKKYIEHAKSKLSAAMLQGADGNSPVIPDGLRLALSNAGIAAPESDEMLAATCEKYIQELVTWVKDRKPFRSAVIPDGWVDMLHRWLAFGSGMQNAGSQLPRNLIAETEAIIAAAPQQEVTK